MKHLIILSGNSLKNKGWGELMLAEYGPQFDSAFMLAYDHWVSGEANINFATEEAKLVTHVASLPADEEILLFAKSAGSLLSLLSIYHGTLTPARVVFFGMPLDLAAGNMFKDSWEPLSSLSMPSIAFHNIADPTTSYEFTKDALATHNPAITLITTHESDHWYGDTNSYHTHLQMFLNFDVKTFQLTERFLRRAS
jgi:hypothetical protein